MSHVLVYSEKYCFLPVIQTKHTVHREGKERVQKIFTRMLPGLDGLSYKERLDRLGFLSLERRRLRGDLVEFYKIMRGTDQLDSQYLFPKVRGV